MTGFRVGVDLGGTQIRALVLSAEGQVCGRAATLTHAADGPTAVIERIAQTIRQAVGDVAWTDIDAIGVGAPGPLDPWKGVVIQAPNLPGWHHVPLAEILNRTFGIPTQVGNDANLAALGEHAYGAGRGVRDLIYLTISTGIGGGIITHGELLLGAGGFAGEVGHQTIVEDGPLCGCGNRGCLEALAAGPAISRMGRQAVADGRGQHMLALVGGRPEEIDARVVAKAALAGDVMAREIIRKSATYIGTGLGNLCNLFNPALFILGGGVTHVGDLLFDTVRSVMAERAMPAMRDARIVPAALGDDVVLYGAIALVGGRTTDLSVGMPRGEARDGRRLVC